MTRNGFFISFVSCLVLAPFAALGAEGRGRDFTLDAGVTLDAYRATVEARLEGVLTATRTLAATEEVRSGDWSRMREPLAVFAANVTANAAVWFAPGPRLRLDDCPLECHRCRPRYAARRL